MSKTYKNGLFKKKFRTEVQKSVFMKKSVQKSVLVRTNSYKWEHWTEWVPEGQTVDQTYYLNVLATM